MKSFKKIIPILFYLFLCASLCSAIAGNLEKGVELYNQKKFTEAFFIIETEAKKGDGEAQFLLGKMYDFGNGTKKNLNKAVYWYRKGAERGNAKAMFNLALMYSTGEGVNKDLKQAHKFYLKSAESGNDAAQFNLALMYLNGEGVQQNYKKAYEWFYKAALQGDKVAQYNIGLMYKKGVGVQQDYSRAFYWYKKSAEQNYSDAEYALGLIYQRGLNVPVNRDEAIKWYKKAADQGHITSMYNLASMYLPEDDPSDASRWDEVYKWYALAMEHGDRKNAPFGMGLIYLFGRGNYPIDNQKAAELFTLSAENGKVDSWYWLGVMEEYGFGRPYNTEKAFELYRKAAALGSGPAIRRLNMKEPDPTVKLFHFVKDLFEPQ